MSNNVSKMLPFCKHWNMKKFHTSWHLVNPHSWPHSEGCRRSDLESLVPCLFPHKLYHLSWSQNGKKKCHWLCRAIINIQSNTSRLFTCNLVLSSRERQKICNIFLSVEWAWIQIKFTEIRDVYVNFQHRKSSGTILIEISGDTALHISWRSSLGSVRQDS